jgi:predicted glycosyltransferase
MRILVGMAHPKHVYMFKNFIKEMEKRGHEVKILAIEKDLTEYLLKEFNLPYTLIGKNPPTIYKKVLSVPKWEYLTLNIAREFRPDIYIGRALPHFAHVSAILRKPYIIFEDTEHATTVQKVCFPFTDAIVTPSCYKEDLGKKQVCFEGYYELAYLHPNYFTSNPAVLDEIGLSKDDTYTILRFVSWSASHDVGQHGIKNKIELVRKLEKYGRVFITSEGKLEDDLEKYKIKVSPEKIHDLLYYASLYVGEGATMATESAILGTPSIYVSSLVGTMGNFEELEQKYGLIFNYREEDKVLQKAVELIQKPNIKEEWKKKRKELLKDKIDVTAFMVWFIENYPESFTEMKENPQV